MEAMEEAVHDSITRKIYNDTQDKMIKGGDKRRGKWKIDIMKELY